MDLSSEKNTFYKCIVNGSATNAVDYHVKQSEISKSNGAKAGPSHIPRPLKYMNYMKKEPTAEINRNINRNVLFINGDDDDSSSRTSKKGYRKQLLPSLHKFEFYTNIDSEESSSNFLSFGPKPSATHIDTNIEQPRFYTKDEINSPQYAEKTTYCRPVLNLNNPAFIYKTMERNARLQQLAKRLVDVREKEKQKEAWNNYVNELRNKHKYAEVSHFPNYVQDESPDIIDYYNTRFSWQQSNPCHNLLNEFYDIPSEMNINDYAQRSHTNGRPYVFENSSYCYPTSSQGRLLALNREWQNNRYKQWEYPPPNRYIRGKTSIGENDYEEPVSSKQRYRKTPIIKNQFSVNKEVNTNVIRSLAVQTDFIKSYKTKTDNTDKNTLKEKYNLVSSNVKRLKQRIIQTTSSEKINKLHIIENKIDILIDSVNTFLSEIKSKKLMTTQLKSRAASSMSIDSKKISFQHKNDHANFLKNEIICGIVQEKPKSIILHENTRDTIEDILFEEMNKSDQVKKDIEEILTKSSDNSCSVHIEFDIPTKERSTEVTDSLTRSKTVYNPQVNIEVFARKDDRKMTIAVNTDPLGLLALIRVSAETLKRLLSFVPQIDYYSYLSMLQFSQATNVSSFVCNICGAAFNKPSQLNIHIQNHYLDKSR